MCMAFNCQNEISCCLGQPVTVPTLPVLPNKVHKEQHSVHSFPSRLTVDPVVPGYSDKGDPDKEAFHVKSRQ